MEIWKTIPGFEKYQISNYGNIRSIPRKVILYHGGVKQYSGKILKQQKDNQGYHVVSISSVSGKKNKTIHRLVSECFIDNPFLYPEVNHKDGDKTNNHVSNLEWCTRKYNQEHAKSNGLIKRASKEVMRNAHSSSFRGIYAIDIVSGKIIHSFEGIGIAIDWLRDNGFPKAADANILKSAKTGYKTAYGYRWKYE